jgi:hypothetical protein
MTVYVCHKYTSYGRSLNMATFHVDLIELDRFVAPEKKCSRLHLSAGWAVRGTRLSFSPNTTIEAVRLIQTSVDEQATRLTRLISQACVQYVQYLLTGTSPLVLNRHRRGLPHRNIGITTTLSLSFPSECSTNPLNWPCPVSDYPYNKYQLYWRGNKP